MDRELSSKVSSYHYCPPHFLTNGSYYSGLENSDIYTSCRETLKNKRSFNTYRDNSYDSKSSYRGHVSRTTRYRCGSLTNALRDPTEFNLLDYRGLKESKKYFLKQAQNSSYSPEFDALISFSQPPRRSNYIYRSNDMERQCNNFAACKIPSLRTSQFTCLTRRKSSDIALSKEFNGHDGFTHFSSRYSEPRNVKPVHREISNGCWKKLTSITHSPDLVNDSHSINILREPFVECPTETAWKEVQAGDIIKENYLLLEEIGSGSFGRVFRALNQKMGIQCALKCMKKCPKFEKVIRQELHVFELLELEDPNGNENIVKFYESFSWNGNTCIVFELLCVNLYQIISRNNFKGLPCMTVKKMSACILNSLKFLHKHQIIHCDLKPENVLMVRPGYPLVKIIDFGSSCRVGHTLYTYIQSRFYRAPEVILGMEYDSAIDIWSLGCIIMELLTGTPLFPGADEYDQMACIVEVLGLPPPSFLRKARRLRTFFCDSVRLRHHSAGQEKTYPARSPPLHTMPRGLPGSLPLQVLLQHSLGDVDSDLLDFIQRCVCWVSSGRLTASEAMNHPWLRSLKSTNMRMPDIVDSPEKKENTTNASETDGKCANSQLSPSATDPLPVIETPAILSS